MANAPQIPPSIGEQNPNDLENLEDKLDLDAAQALIPVLSGPETQRDPEEMDLAGPVALLPVELDVTIPVRDFRVRNLLTLEPGYLIQTQWHNGDDVPLSASAVHLAWSEFEVIENDLAVRITRLP